MAGGGLAVVYSSDCPAGLERVAVDSTFVWQCDGIADQVQVNAAINAVAATGQNSTTPPSGGGGSVLLVGYNFNFSAPAQIQSWVDLSGAFGRAGCQVNASAGFSGTALIETGQTYSELTTIHDMTLNGSNSGSEHGIYYNGQVTQTPFTYSDPVHTLCNLVIMNSGGSGLYFDTAVRVTNCRDIRIGKAGVYGFYGGGFTDSMATNVFTLGAGSDGIYCGGSDATYTGCRSDNSHGNGFNVAQARVSLTGCEAEDSTFNNFLVSAGKVVLTGCTSDSAGLGSSATYDGFALNSSGGGVTDTVLTGCQSYDRNGSPHQRYGVYLAGSCTYTYIICNTYGNATGSFGGTTTPGTGSVYNVFGS